MFASSHRMWRGRYKQTRKKGQKLQIERFDLSGEKPSLAPPNIMLRHLVSSKKSG
jgi:hypothetical protein